MSSFNRVTLIGNLTRDPQLKNLPNGGVVTEFGMAMSRRFRTQAGEDREDVCFVDCAAFGKQGQLINDHCRKGKQLFIEGRLKYDTWDDKAGQGKRSKLSVIVENFQFIGSKQDSVGSHGGQTQELPWQPAGHPTTGRNSNADEARFQEADIPF